MGILVNFHAEMVTFMSSLKSQFVHEKWESCSHYGTVLLIVFNFFLVLLDVLSIVFCCYTAE